MSVQGHCLPCCGCLLPGQKFVKKYDFCTSSVMPMPLSATTTFTKESSAVSFYRYKTAGWSKLNSIGDQIGPDLKDQVFVSIERYFRKIQVNINNFWQTRWALGKGLPDGSVHLKRRIFFSEIMDWFSSLDNFKMFPVRVESCRELFKICSAYSLFCSSLVEADRRAA